MTKRAILLIICFLMALFSACGGPDENKDGIREEDLLFAINEKAFSLGGDVKPLLDELGEDYELSEAPSCLYEGMDKSFEYDGISIYTYPLDGKDIIDEIQLNGKQYKTGRDISVGDTLEDITAAYGEDYVEEGDVITYRLNTDDIKSPCIYFIMRDGVVESISYYSASNL